MNLAHSRLLATLFFALACVPALAGIRDEAPPRVDAFTGVMNRQELSAGDPRALARPKALRAAMLLSENTQKHVAWCEAQTGGVGSIDRAFKGLFGGAQAVSDSDRVHMLAYDPKFVTDGVTRPLVQRFGALQLVGSLQEFRQGGFDVLLLVDVSFVNTFSDGFIIGSKYETATFINVYFIDGARQLLGKVETGELKTVARNTYLQSVAQVRKATMDSYEAALTSLLGPVPGTAQPAAATVPAPAPARSPQERLKAVDDLLRQGLLTPDEAAAKRAEILKTL
jgi:hypothetical protein